MQTIIKKLASAHKGIPFLPPLERLIYATLFLGGDEKDVWVGMNRLRKFYVDWNETRAARRTEIGEVLDPLENSDDRSARMKLMLNRLFDLRGGMDLTFLAETKPAEARRYLIDFDKEIPRSIIALVLFELCPGTTIPLTREGLREARKVGLVGRGETKAALQTALQEAVTPVEAAAAVYYLEYIAHPPSKFAKKRKAKKRTKKKTTKPASATEPSAAR